MKKSIIGPTESVLRKYPKAVRELARKYDCLSRKLDSETLTDEAFFKLYAKIGRVGDELAFRCMWGGHPGFPR